MDGRGNRAGHLHPHDILLSDRVCKDDSIRVAGGVTGFGKIWLWIRPVDLAGLRKDHTSTSCSQGFQLSVPGGNCV
jgi:hypothetical protein